MQDCPCKDLGEIFTLSLKPRKGTFLLINYDALEILHILAGHLQNVAPHSGQLLYL